MEREKGDNVKTETPSEDYVLLDLFLIHLYNYILFPSKVKLEND